MAGSTIKMGVDVTQFKQGMQQAQQSAKTFQAQMKANEAQFKATGDKEQYLTEKGKLLKKELEAQKTAAANAEKALEAMRKNGVEETSAEYQKLEQQLAGTQAAMYNTQAAMNALTTSEGQAATGAKSVADNLNSINKKVSLDAVIKGVNSISGALDSVASKAKQVGESIWEDIKSAAKAADDYATTAEMYEIPLERYLQMMALEAEGLDTSTTAILTSQDKLKKGLNSENATVRQFLIDQKLLSVATDVYGNTWETMTETDPEKLFWEIGQAIKNMDPNRLDKEATAMALFGRSWRELLPLFNKYSSLEEYNEALAGTTTNSEDAITKMAKLNDRISALEHSWDTLKLEVLSGLAPALEAGAKALSEMLNSLTEYLQTPEGKQALEDMEKAVSGLFADLSNIDPQEVVEGFAGVFNKIVGGLEWLSQNSGTVINAMGAIVTGWGLLKLTGGALQILQLINGLNSLSGKTSINLPNVNGQDPGGTGDQAVTTQSVTTQNVSSATLSNVTAAVTSATTTTENVTTMYVQTLITGSGLPGTGDNPGGIPTNTPIAIPPASDMFSGYIPPVATDGLPAGSGTGIGNPAQNYLTSGGGGGSDINITGDNPTINTPGVPKDAIHLTPDEYEVSSYDKVGFLGAAAMKIGQVASGLATMDPTGVTALIIPWLLDNTAFGQKLQQGGTVLEAAEESAKVVRELPATIAKNYQELVDAQYQAIFGKDTKELGTDAKKALTDLWNSVKNGVLDPVAEKATKIADDFNDALEQPVTKTVNLQPRGGWPYSYGGGMGAN